MSLKQVIRAAVNAGLNARRPGGGISVVWYWALGAIAVAMMPVEVVMVGLVLLAAWGVVGIVRAVRRGARELEERWREKP